ncbi:hypothetical protein ABFT23_02270 [Nocardioides sp. C4-1]|uniref:hypothetical protein n=1 Tax=Nocardioides sp. C4-1 TaxID=3151851 RepID=UPI003263FCA7
MSRGGPKGPRGGKRSAQTATTTSPAPKIKTQPKPVEGKARTARDTRQELPIPNMEQVRALYPDRVATTIALSHPDRSKPKFPDSRVEASIDFIKHSGTAEFITTRRDARKIKAGRPVKITNLAILVAMHLTVADGGPLLLTVIRQTLLERLGPTMRAMLDIKFPTRPANLADHNRWEEAADAAVRRAFHRILDSIDPSTVPKNRIRSWDEMAILKKDLSIAEQQERSAALDWFGNQLLEAAYQQLPESVRDRLAAKGHAYAIDATVIQAFARGRGIDNETASSDPDAGWYVREGDHRDPQDVPPGQKPTTRDLKFKRASSKYVFGREAHLLTLADISHAKRLYAPHIPFAFNTGVPGVNPAEAAISTFANVLHRGHQAGPVAGDILYTNQAAAKYQIPARRAGFDLVLGYGKDQLGVQGSHSSGMQMLEGTYVAPCIPDHLINAVQDYALLGSIDDLEERRAKHREINERVKARLEYRMRTKDTTKTGDPATGTADIKERLSCPAAGTNPTAICALKPKSQKDRPIRQANGTVVDLRRTIDHRKVLTNGHAPKVCTQETVTVTIEDGAKFRQSMPFASPEQISTYNRLRQGTEGVHGTAKDEAKIALANPGRRRVRGWAAMQVFTAFLLAETATQRIITFIKNAVTDNEGHLYVPRRERTGNHGPTGAPPGTALPGAPPIPDLAEVA